MSSPPRLPPETVRHVATTCLCLAAQRAARALARRFDTALRPVGLTNGQFSMLMALNRDPPARIGDLAAFLAMDRTTVTAAVKTLAWQGLVATDPDPADRRGRRVSLTAAGLARLKAALPVWRDAHAALDAALPAAVPPALRRDLARIARTEPADPDAPDDPGARSESHPQAAGPDGHERDPGAPRSPNAP